MRQDLRIVSVSLVVALAACSGGHEQSATRLNVQKKADVADLSAAPKAYTPMRFVSPIEQSTASTPARVRRAAQHTPVRTVAATNASNPIASLASHQPPAMSTTSAVSVPDANLTVAMHLAAEPAPMKMAPVPTPGESGMIDHVGEAGHTVAVGTSVIRGGLMGGEKKCDPRTDTHTTPQELGRPDFKMPSPVGRSVFSGRQR